MEKIINNYKKIIENYKNFNGNIRNINEDIKNLENIHHLYIRSVDTSAINYSVYIDDIKHQINLTRIEFEYINQIYLINIEKLYRDLFKLYNRVTKNLLMIYKENKDLIIKIWKSNEKINYETAEFRKLKKSIKLMSDNARSNNPTTNDNKIFEEIKKQYYLNIIIYNEMEKTHVYEIDDIVKIFDNLTKRIEELLLSCELIKINLIDIQSKTEKGILGQTFMMDLNGKKDRIKVDYNIVVKILESTINMHFNLSEKYSSVSKKISDEVSCCEDTTLSIDNKIDKNNDTINEDKENKDDDIFIK
jgi:hypothetical protein